MASFVPGDCGCRRLHLPRACRIANLATLSGQHSTFGDMGTYSNTIKRDGTITTVETEAHFKVSVLGVVLYREDAERTERWASGRLIYFASTTTTNGHTEKVQGQAQSDNFVIKSDSFGTLVAPPTIVPANPWSANFLGSDTMMRVDTGSIEHVRVSTGTNTSVRMNGKTIPAREYQVEGKDDRYMVWLDEHNVPIKFNATAGGNEVTFTLIDHP
jgi:hypothetical protein